MKMHFKLSELFTTDAPITQNGKLGSNEVEQSTLLIVLPTQTFRSSFPFCGELVSVLYWLNVNKLMRLLAIHPLLHPVNQFLHLRDSRS
jgi:hypothetical protein